MSTHCTVSVCLVLLVRPAQKLNTETLLSAKPFVSNWIVGGESLSEADQARLRSTMMDLEGELHLDRIRNYADTTNKLLNHAAKCADYSLFLNNGEIFSSFGDSPFGNTSTDLVYVDVIQNRHRIKQVRLINNNECNDHQSNVAHLGCLDVVNQAGLTSSWSSRFSILDPRPVNRTDQIDNRTLLDQVINDQTKDAASLLHLAKLELAHSNIEAAKAHLTEIQSDFSDSLEFWLACYMLGNLLISRDEYEAGIEILQHCIAQSPERVEPILSIARAHYQRQDYDTVKKLCELAMGVGLPLEAEYYEPASYDFDPYFLAAQAALKQGDREQARKFVAQLNEDQHLKMNREQRETLKKFVESKEFTSDACE